MRLTAQSARSSSSVREHSTKTANGNSYSLTFESSLSNMVQNLNSCKEPSIHGDFADSYIDEDLIRFLKLTTSTVPSKDNIESFARWMNAVKPLIQPETRFLDFSGDFVTSDRDIEEGLIEEVLEKAARKCGIGSVSCKISTHYCPYYILLTSSSS